jgi:hypothetical protein
MVVDGLNKKKKKTLASGKVTFQGLPQMWLAALAFSRLSLPTLMLLAESTKTTP